MQPWSRWAHMSPPQALRSEACPLGSGSLPPAAATGSCRLLSQSLYLTGAGQYQGHLSGLNPGPRINGVDVNSFGPNGFPIYKRQVFKNSISKATLEEGSDRIMKYFDSDELIELLKYDREEVQSKTLELLNDKHPFSVPETPTLTAHIPFLNSIEEVEGVTNHGNLFSVEEDEEEIEDQEELIAKQFAQFQPPSFQNDMFNSLPKIRGRFEPPFLHK